MSAQQTFTLEDFKRDPSQVLTKVCVLKQEVMITKDGEPFAVLSPAEEGDRNDDPAPSSPQGKGKKVLQTA